MRKLITLLIAVLLTATVWAQAPQKMSYQAVIRNTSNQLVTTQVGMQISILQGTSNGTPVYVETQTPTPNANGLVSIEIGGGTPVTGTFAVIDWSAGPYFIKTETAIVAPLTTYTIEGTSQLLSVPYALFAKTAGNDTRLQSQINMLKNSIAGEGVVKDYENNVYNTIKIGTQIWMSENLKTTKYNDGTLIPNITDNTEWSVLISPSYCWYNNDAATYKTTYGAFYNWYTVNAGSNGGKNICPIGWHVPTDGEWTMLTDYLTANSYGFEGSGSDIGKSMASTTGWANYEILGNVGNDQASNNSSGFTSIPGGNRDQFGIYSRAGTFCYWWSTTELSSTIAWSRIINYNGTNVYRNSRDERYGFSIRCLHD
jgi:uncharacterized protein (TIGR02145 family)